MLNSWQPKWLDPERLYGNFELEGVGGHVATVEFMACGNDEQYESELALARSALARYPTWPLFLRMPEGYRPARVVGFKRGDVHHPKYEVIDDAGTWMPAAKAARRVASIG
jgi:hypothetical protein